nr:endothelin-converting enzyme 2-like [Rhipicephalus microplus]
MASPVKPDNSQGPEAGQELPQEADSTPPVDDPPRHGIRHVVDQAEKDGGRKAPNEPQHSVGISRRASDEINPRSVRRVAAYKQPPQPQHSRAMPSLLDLSGRGSHMESHTRYSSTAGNIGSGNDSCRRTSLPPAVVAAAAAALNTPSSARRTSIGSRSSSGVMKPSTMICYTVVAVLCLLVSLTVLFFLLSSLLDSSDPSQPSTCTTHACREYAARLISSINSSVDPCHSFTRFVCDGWRRRQLFGVQEEAFGAANERIARIVRTIDVPPTGQNLLQRAAMLYKSCLAVLTTPTGELDAVKSALRAAGVMWPHRPPPVGKRDLLRMMFHCDYTLGWSAVFRVDPELYQNATKAYVLTDSGFNFVVRKYNERSTEALPRTLFQPSSERVQGHGGRSGGRRYEMQQLEEKMFDPLIADFYRNAPNVTTVPHDVVYSSSANLSMDRWLEVMKREGVVIVGKVEFRTWNLAFFSTFVNLLARHGELDMYAYVFWCTVQVAALFANGELIVNFYGHPPRALILHGAFCLSRAYIAAGKTLLNNYAREILPVVARSYAETLSLNVHTAFLERLNSWADYDADLRMMRSWNSTSLSFSIFAPKPEVDFDDVIVGEMGDSFLQNWRNAWLSRSFFRGFDIKIAITAIETLAFSSDLEYRRGYILLPYVFSFPYYDMNAMNAINYGGFGTQVAFALGQRFRSTYLSADAGGASFSAFLSCVSNASLSTQLKDAQSLFAEVVSLGAVVDAYRNASDDRRLVNLERLTSDQLLFIAICYAKCIGSYYVVHDSMCDAVLKNVPEFSEAFNCALGTPMNPHQQCRLF